MGSHDYSQHFIDWNRYCLTHRGRVTHTCVGKLTTIGSDNGLSPGRCQAIIWTNAGILLIGNLGTNFSEILIKIRPSSFKKMHLKMSSGKWRPFCLGFRVLRQWLAMQQSARHCITQCWIIYQKSTIFSGSLWWHLLNINVIQISN